MKISVIMPTRGRAMQMVGVLNSLRSQESGKNEVTYGIGCDVDDHVTIGTCEILQPRMPIRWHVTERQPSLGARVNQLAELMPADVYCSIADDVLCMTPGWDEKIAEAFAAKDDGVWWWRMHYKEYALYAIVSEKWRQAAGKIFTDYFPYWYDDIWLLELWVLASEAPFLYVDAQLADCPKATHRMRDMAFWHDFWHFMRPERVKKAREIAKNLGWPEPKTADILATVIGRPVPEFVESMTKIEENQGDQGPASIEYIKAKSRAQEMMGKPQDIVKMRKDFLQAIKPVIEEFDRKMGVRAPLESIG